MTLYGIDISSYQAGLSMASVKAQGFDFVTARCAIPTPADHGYVDPWYATFRDECRQVGLLFAAYVFPKSYATPAELAAATKAAIGDPRIPVMIDWESDINSAPSQALAEATYDAITDHGLSPIHVADLYTYEAWWSQAGGHPLTSRPWVLVAANYGSNPTGHAAAVYPGDNSPRWVGFGDEPVAILQFGSNIIIDGHTGVVDGDAYRGTRNQLVASGLFTDWSDDPMALFDTLDDFKTAVRAVLNEGTGVGQQNWAGTERAELATEQGDHNVLALIMQKLTALEAKVEQGPAGPAGPQGEPGPAGPQGEPGPAGVVDASALAGVQAEVTFATPAAAQ